tara:strand:+ start:261 stop:812 length:552 start_codon:yes stop_codon:yes gene_type:complete
MRNIYILVAILIILSTLNIIRNTPLLKNILGFILIITLLMEFKLIKNNLHLLLTGLGILLGLIVIENLLTRNEFELFEDKEEDETTDDDDDDEKEHKETDKKDKNTIENRIDELDKINKEDIDDDDANTKTKIKNLAELKPYEAQRETYQLIETVKNLKDTMQQLGPTLKEAKNILHTYKQFS